MWLFVLFATVPLIEIALFIQIGGLIGLWPTLAIVILTAIAGTYLVRSQGRGVLMQVQRSFNELDDPTEPLAHGAMILFAGALLLTPGFFTDIVGFSLLVPTVRTSMFHALQSRVRVQKFEVHQNRAYAARGDTIEGEFEEICPEERTAGHAEGKFPEPPKKPTHQPSGWTKH